MTTETVQGSMRPWSTPAVLAVALGAFVAGSMLGGLSPASADVRKAEPRDTFKDGALIANQTLEASLVILKRLDDRVANIEEALLTVTKK